MTYQVLARRLRPQRFADVVGQEHVTRTLQAAITAGRVAHAFLFTGPRGVGKTTTARLLAKAINCDACPISEPCNTCSNCHEIAEGNARSSRAASGTTSGGSGWASSGRISGRRSTPRASRSRTQRSPSSREKRRGASAMHSRSSTRSSRR
ncbi:MAG: AAA family ATPase [Deltaproteobacteria bacterium]|nr:MAG: AAA family ATPase [Deltaproteobacteria bacterium]